jgi:hypothetical protein
MNPDEILDLVQAALIEREEYLEGFPIHLYAQLDSFILLETKIRTALSKRQDTMLSSALSVDRCEGQDGRKTILEECAVICEQIGDAISIGKRVYLSDRDDGYQDGCYACSDAIRANLSAPKLTDGEGV